MEVIMRPTDQVVTIEQNGCEVPHRIWQGKTSTGIPCHMYVTRVAVSEDRPEHEHDEFRRALQETEPLRPELQAIPMRLVL